MAITYTIPRVPLLDQLKEASNPTWDCVFTSNAAMATAYLGKPYTGTQIKAMDNDYGPKYTGGADERYLLDTMDHLGITVTETPASTQQGLIDILHREIPQGHAALCTIPSQWNSAVIDPATGKVRNGWNPRTYRGPSHVVLMCGYGPGMLRAMNPWHGVWHDGTDQYWALRLLKGEVWVGTLKGAAKVGIPQGWKDDGKTLVAPNGVPVIRGFRDWILSHPWDANNWPLKTEYQLAQVEWGNLTHGAGTRQDFRLTSLAWTAKDGVYAVWVGQDVQALESQLAAALAHVTALEAQLAAAQATTPAQPDPVAIASRNALQQLKSALAEL